MHRILIGYDGSERGADALALGRALAELLRSGGADAGPDVAVALVYPDGSIGASGQRTLDGEDRRAGGRTLDAARAAWPELPPGAFRLVQSDSTADGLHRVAQEHDVDALVVGASHHGAAGRVFPGSATERTLHGAPCAVLVAPPGYADDPRPLRSLGVAYDGSPEARHALDAGERLAQGREGVTVTMLDVADPLHELVEASRRLDLLLLGSRGHGPFRRLLLGSVSTHVVRTAACPLLLIPHGAAPAGGEAEARLRSAP